MAEWLVAFAVVLLVGALVCVGALVWLEVALRFECRRPLEQELADPNPALDPEGLLA